MATAKRRAQGSGCIYKRSVTKNGKKYEYWIAQISAGVDLAGNAINKQQKTFKSQKAAIEWINQANADIQNCEYLKESRLTVGEWLGTYLDEYCINLKYQTKKSYTAQIKNHIKPALADIRLDKLSAMDIQHFVNQLGVDGQTKRRNVNGKIEIEKCPLSAKSIKNVFEILNVSLEKAVELDLIKRNPAHKVTLPKISKPEIKPLNEAEIANFVNELDSDVYGQALKFILFTGVRECECLGLTWDCIDWKNETVTIKQQLVKHLQTDGGYQIESTKNGKSRVLQVAPSIMDLLKARRQEQTEQRFIAAGAWIGWTNSSDRNNSLVFTDALGKNLTPKSLYIRCKKTCDKINCPAGNVHQLRHTFATLSLQNGDSLKTVSENLGHSGIAITADTYSSVSDTMKKESANKMDAFIRSVAAF